MLFESERLSYRRFEEADASFIYELNLDEEMMRYTGDVAFESVESAQQFVRQYKHYDEYGYGRWSVVRKTDNKLIGWCGLKFHPTENYIDLGYRFARKEWGKGYATEAGKASLEYGNSAFDVNQVVGRTAAGNAASIRVLEKLGFAFWKKAPCEGITDSLFYRIRL